MFTGVMSNECNSLSGALTSDFQSAVCVYFVCDLQVPVSVTVNAGIVELAD